MKRGRKWPEVGGSACILGKDGTTEAICYSNCYVGDVLADDIVFLIPGACVEALFVADPLTPSREIQSKSSNRRRTPDTRQRRSEMDRPGKSPICETYK